MSWHFVESNMWEDLLKINFPGLYINHIGNITNHISVYHRDYAHGKRRVIYTNIIDISLFTRHCCTSYVVPHLA